MAEKMGLQQAFDRSFNAVKQYVDRSFEQFELRLHEIAALNAKIERLEAALAQKMPVKYLGIHRPGAEYSEGSIVTRDGSMFHANKTTRETPGDGNQDWCLCVKHGRDGRDGKDAR